MPRTPLDQLARALDDTGRLVADVRHDQWDAPTPCTEWSVVELVHHLVAGHLLFARAITGEESEAGLALEETRADPALAYSTSADAMLAAFNTPGVLEASVTVPFGTVPATVALHLRLVDALVHGWDLCTATGQPFRYDAEIAHRALVFSQERLADAPPGRRRFAPPVTVEDGATVLDRLAALLGRDPVGGVS